MQTLLLVTSDRHSQIFEVVGDDSIAKCSTLGGNERWNRLRSSNYKTLMTTLEDEEAVRWSPHRESKQELETVASRL